MKIKKVLRNLIITLMVITMTIPTIDASAAAKKGDAVNFTPGPYDTTYKTDITPKDVVWYEYVSSKYDIEKDTKQNKLEYITILDVVNVLSDTVQETANRLGKTVKKRSIANIKGAAYLSEHAKASVEIAYGLGAVTLKGGCAALDKYATKLDVARIVTKYSESLLTIYGVREDRYISDVKISPYPSYAYQIGIFDLKSGSKFDPYAKIDKANYYNSIIKIAGNTGYGIEKQDIQRAFSKNYKVGFESLTPITSENQTMTIGEVRNIEYNPNFDYDFSVDDSDIVSIQYTSWNGVYKYANIIAKKSGTTKLNIKASGITVKTINITVRNSSTYVSISIPDTTLKVGASAYITPNYYSSGSVTLKWKSSDPAIASIGEYDGKVIAKKEGYTTITVTANGTINATCVVTVYKNSISFRDGTSYLTNLYDEFSIPVVTNPGQQVVTWESSNSNIISIDRYSGNAKALSVGTASITASLPDGTKTSCSVTVKSSTSTISFDSTDKDIYVGYSYQVTSYISGQYNQDYYLMTENSNIAEIDYNTGILKGKSEGITYLSLIYKGNIIARMRLIVKTP